MNTDENEKKYLPNPKEEIIPSAVGDIHVPSSKIPFDLNINFSNELPIQIQSQSPNQGYGVSTTESGLEKEKPGFFKTAAAEFYEFNTPLELLHAGYEKYQQPNPLEDNTPPDFKPTNYPDMFYDVDPKYLPYLMGSRGLKDLQYRKDRVTAEQNHDETLANGSTFAKIIGGFAGAIADPVSWIPIVGWTKYAKFAPTIMKSASKAFPGIAAAGIIQSAAKELDSVNGNLSNFVLDAGINTVIGTAIFGGIGAGALALDKMQLWGLKDLLQESMKGIEFKFNVGEKGEVIGFKAVDTTGNLSAAEVNHAQEIADSSFHKSGIFKIPYLGTGIIKLAGAPYIGSPLIQMLNSHYEIERAFADRSVDHSILTKGVAEGKTQGKTFDHLMKREFADLRSIAMQMNTLHLERMGYSIKNRPLQDVSKLGLNLYNTGLKTIGKDVDKFGFVSRDQFDDEVQRVLFSGESSEHASVNTAASILRKKIDDTWKLHLEATGKSPIIAPPKFAEKFLMRVYNTKYMNVNKPKWIEMVRNYLRESDQLITDRMEPINSLRLQIKEAKKLHEDLIKRQNVSDQEIKSSSDAIEKIKKDLKFQKEKLQNELRNNEDLIYHVDDIYALSADESKELKKLLKPSNVLKKQIEEQKSILEKLKQAESSAYQKSIQSKTIKNAKKNSSSKENLTVKIKDAESKLNELKNKLTDVEYDLYSKARNGDISPHFYYPETHQFKNPNYKLKFRKIHESDITRENLASAYYDSIMHMNPEDIISDIMGKLKGSSSENTLQSRSVMIPDELLYNNNFMTKDLMSKLNNYVLYLSRRTNLKNVFKDVTHNGGIEPIIEKLRQSYLSNKNILEQKKVNTTNKKELDKINKSINNETKKFNQSKERMQKAYERMMGIRKRERAEVITQGVIRSLVAMANLHYLPVTQIADIGAIGLQTGAWPFIRDAVYPIITSINGLIKTKDSEAIRRAAAHVNLGLQDVLNGHADKALSIETQPYVNMGRWVGGVEKLAHYSSNLDLTTYIDNFLQRMAGAAWQSEFMKTLIDHTKGKASTKDLELLRKYGIDPFKWSERMVKAYKESDGHKTLLGGHQSMFWKWQDLEASNEFSSAVFRAIQNTIINRGLLDSPFWHENILGMILQTFSGWGYASVNRYLIPLLQRPDAEKMLGVLTSLAFGSLVSPTRRWCRGEEAYPDSMDDEHRFWEVISDSSVTAALANVLSYANLLSGDRLLGDLKNDKYRERTRIGAGSAIFGTANRIGDIFSSLATGEMNEKDAKQMARILPLTGTIYGYGISKVIIERLGLPPNRKAAQAENN